MHILEVLDDDLGVEFGRHHCDVRSYFKRTRTAADGDKHRASLAMNSDGTRHPLKEPERNAHRR